MRYLWALFWSAMTAVCGLLSLAVVVLVAMVGSAHAQTYYLQEDWEWTPGNSNWPYKNMIGDAGHTCPHTIEHGWDNELFDICPNNAGNTCTWGDGSGEHPCNWAATGISTAQHKSGTRSFYTLNPGWQRDSGDITKTFTATTVGQPIWVNFWIRFDSTWANYSPATAEPYIHFYFLNTGQGATGPRMNLQTFGPYTSPHVCGPGGTAGLPSTSKYLFPLPQSDGRDWSTGTYPQGCYNIMDHLNEWLWMSTKWDPPTTPGANGTIEIWFNDVMYYTATEAWAQNDTGCQNAFCKFIISNFRSVFNGSGPYDQGVYYDDISITDVRLSAPGGGTVPTADFTCSPLSMQAPSSTTCTDSSTNTPTSWAWTSGCGSSSVQNPSFTCPIGGRKNVCLTATNATGSSTQFCRNNYLSVKALPPKRPRQR